MKIYTPNYSRFHDRKHGIDFEPALLEGFWVGVAEVTDKAAQADLLSRGFLEWPMPPKPPAKPKAQTKGKED